MNTDEILDILEEMYPEAKAELNYNNPFELTIAVVLSAQTTDISVNKVTPLLFEKYPSPYELSKAKLKDVEDIIKSIGLYKNKAKNIISLSKKLVDDYNGEVPINKKDLLSLDGVGIKSSNVIRSVAFNIPSIAVDTHVSRVSKRLNLAKKDDSVIKVEEKLKRKIKRNRWSKAHHLFIFFGRYKCKAIKPVCKDCPFINFCKEEHKNIKD